MADFTPLAPTRNLHRIWLLRLVPRRAGIATRSATALVIVAVTWCALWLLSNEISRYELLFFSCLFGYSIVIFARIVEQSEDAIEDIRTSTYLSDERLEQLRFYMASHTRKELVYTLLGAVVCGCIHIALIRVAYGTPLRAVLADSSLYAAQVGTMLAWIILTVVISSLINNALAWSRLGKQLDIDLLQPRATHAIGRIAVLSTLSIIGAQVLFVILLLESGWNWVSVFPGLLASFQPTLAMFFIPVWPLHVRLKDEKRKALARLDASIRDLGKLSDLQLNQGSDVDQLNRLLQLRREVIAASVWPFDTSNFLKFLFYLLIPPLTWVGAALVENAVSTIVE